MIGNGAAGVATGSWNADLLSSVCLRETRGISTRALLHSKGLSQFMSVDRGISAANHVIKMQVTAGSDSIDHLYGESPTRDRKLGTLRRHQSTCRRFSLEKSETCHVRLFITHHDQKHVAMSRQRSMNPHALGSQSHSVDRKTKSIERSIHPVGMTVGRLQLTNDVLQLYYGGCRIQFGVDMLLIQDCSQDSRRRIVPDDKVVQRAQNYRPVR